jgi:hypothetical protein
MDGTLTLGKSEHLLIGNNIWTDGMMNNLPGLFLGFECIWAAEPIKLNLDLAHFIDLRRNIVFNFIG